MPKKNCKATFMKTIDSINSNENGCKTWSMGINSSGYGIYSINNKSYNVHRLLYEIVNDEILSKEYVIRHKCDNRSCCNIDHLEIGTQRDNLNDASKRKRLRVGEDNNMSSLTEETVIYCRNSYPLKSTWELSKELGIDHGNIGKAICGSSWKHLPGRKSIISNNRAFGEKASRTKLTEKEVLEIRAQYPNKTGPQLAKEYGVGHAMIYCIVKRKNWRHL